MTSKGQYFFPIIIGLTPSPTPSPALILFCPLPLSDCPAPPAPPPLQTPPTPPPSSASAPFLTAPFIPIFKGGMKQKGAKLTPSKAPKTPAKTQRRSKVLTSKGTGTTRARVGEALPEKPRKDSGPEKMLSAATALDSSPIAAAMVQEEEEERPLGWDKFGGWWWWGMEEEMLLGWFSFVEDLPYSENKGGSGLFWEEEDHTISGSSKTCTRSPTKPNEMRNMVIWKGRERERERERMAKF